MPPRAYHSASAMRDTEFVIFECSDGGSPAGVRTKDKGNYIGGAEGRKNGFSILRVYWSLDKNCTLIPPCHQLLTHWHTSLDLSALLMRLANFL